jgi:hypothetical protein
MRLLNDLAFWFPFGQGSPPSEELAAARRPLDRRSRRLACRAVRRGEAAPTPDAARYAVALARAVGRQARSRSRWEPLILAIVGVAGLAFGVHDVLNGSLTAGGALALLLGATVGWSAWSIPRRDRAAAAAKVANLEVLERDGAPYVPPGSASAARLPLWVNLLGVPFDFLWSTVAFGAVMTLFDHDQLTLANMWDHGWIYGVVVTPLNAYLRQRSDEEV